MKNLAIEIMNNFSRKQFKFQKIDLNYKKFIKKISAQSLFYCLFSVD